MEWERFAQLLSNKRKEELRERMGKGAVGATAVFGADCPKCSPIGEKGCVVKILWPPKNTRQ